MASPFPGMDPYLEHPAVWPSVHAALIAEIGRQLGKVLRPRYVARIEKRVYISDEDDLKGSRIVSNVAIRHTNRNGKTEVVAKPLLTAEPISVVIDEDHEVEEWSLRILRVGSQKLVTIIELVSPANKAPGSVARRKYLAKQREILASDTHWMEIDLLRGGRSTIPSSRRDESDYAAFVSRADTRPKSELWPIALESKLPLIKVPLSDGDADVVLDLQAAFTAVYDDGYDLETDYSVNPVPPLTAKQSKWAKKLLKQPRHALQ